MCPDCRPAQGRRPGTARWSTRIWLKKRRNLVLGIMRDQGLITDIQHRMATGEPVLAASGATATGSAPYFVQYIVPTLEAAIGPSLLYKGGLTVHTTLSHRLQQAAEKAMADGLSRLHKRRSSGKKSRQQPPGGTGGHRHPDRWDSGHGRAAGIFSKSAFNRAVDARRQPGSAFKPIIYALAITRGFTQASLVLDAPVVFKGRRQ